MKNFLNARFHRRNTVQGDEKMGETAQFLSSEATLLKKRAASGETEGKSVDNYGQIRALARRFGSSRSNGRWISPFNERGRISEGKRPAP
jgi:hypothetical protein